MPGAFSSKQDLLFDLDGTLIDSSLAHAESFEQALRRNHPQLACRFDYRQHRGRTTRDVFVSLGLRDREELETLTVTKQAQYREAVARGAVHVCDGVRPLLERAKASARRLFIVTGASGVSARAALASTGLGGFFDGMVTADDVVAGKPSPEPYLCLLSQYRLRPTDCLAIEDSEHGVMSAIAAGIEPVLVNTDAVVAGVVNVGPIENLATLLLA